MKYPANSVVYRNKYSNIYKITTYFKSFRSFFTSLFSVISMFAFIISRMVSFGILSSLHFRVDLFGGSIFRTITFFVTYRASDRKLKDSLFRARYILFSLFYVQISSTHSEIKEVRFQFSM